VEEDWVEDATRRAKAALISTLVPNAKRVADYMYGGQNNFEADRKAAWSLAAAAPVVGRIAPAVRGFQQRALRFLVLEGGIRQFLDIGTDLPLVGSTHDVAQSLAPESRIAYVDNDPMVLSHARALMKSDPRGVVGYVDADVRDPGAIVAGAQGTLDFSQPIAVMLLFTLSYVQDTEEAAKVVSSLMAAVPSGSFLAIYHLASDLDDTMDEAARMWNKMMPTQSIVLRSAVEVGNLVPGLVPVPPGLVPVTDWRPVIDSRLDRADLVPASVPVHGIVARKP
jgi:ABC-type sugar transport system substrate-binding protein